METRRPTSPAAEEILGGYFPVLDHGWASLVDYMGSDEDVERAARVSYGHGTRKSSQTPRARPLPASAPPHHAVRNGGAQVPLRDADFRSTAMDPAQDRIGE